MIMHLQGDTELIQPHKIPEKALQTDYIINILVSRLLKDMKGELFVRMQEHSKLQLSLQRSLFTSI